MKNLGPRSRVARLLLQFSESRLLDILPRVNESRRELQSPATHWDTVLLNKDEILLVGFLQNCNDVDAVDFGTSWPSGTVGGLPDLNGAKLFPLKASYSFGIRFLRLESNFFRFYPTAIEDRLLFGQDIRASSVLHSCFLSKIKLQYITPFLDVL